MFDEAGQAGRVLTLFGVIALSKLLIGDLPGKAKNPPCPPCFLSLCAPITLSCKQQR